MASAGAHAFGIQLKRGDGGSPETFVEVAEVIDVNLPALSRDAIEMTSHDSPDKYREFIAGLKDAGELAFEYNLVQGSGSQSVLLTDFESGTIRNWQMILPTQMAITIAFTAFVMNWGGESPIDDRIRGQATLRLTGKPTVTSL